MPSLSPNPTIRRSEKYPISPAITVLRVLLCLALAGCSAKDETVAPPQSQAPTIVAQPTVVVSGLGARITATVNPNGVDTDCYFEYGPTAAYGTKLPTKFIQAKLADVVISDTLQNLTLDSTYHCRLVASNSAGTTQSIDKAFSVANTSPTIVSETSVSVFGNTAVLTATVNANYRSTDCYFEYGQNTSYGTHTAARSIGAGGSGVVVKDTIKGLSWDTTYHCRLVAENPAGRAVGTDQSFTCSSAGWVDFMYPLDAGTTWRYRYYYRVSQPVGSSRVDQITGTQLWKSTGGGTGNSIRINVTKIDTTRLWWAGTDTTMEISVTDTSFLVEISPDSFFVHWYSLTHFPLWTLLGKIPRKIGFNTDTFTIVSGSSDHPIRAIYASRKGLTSYVYSHRGNYHGDEQLILESMSP